MNIKKMVKGLLVFVLVFAFVSISFAGDVYVKGYYKQNGTYVQPYVRSAPNNTVTDNYSYKGNTNPHTGTVGTNYYRNNPTSGYYGSTTLSKPTYQTPSYSTPAYKTYKWNEGLSTKP